jgi:pilus assembly protein CpaF
LVRDIVNEMVGLGPLERYLEDETVTEIMVNGHRQLYVERAGHIDRVEGGFISDEQVLRVIERIIGPQGRRIDESSPMVDARLPDGSRVNAIIPPLSVDGPLLTIRKFASKPLLLDDLIRKGTLTREMAEFLASGVRDRKNIIIVGGTGSGKTTLLNALSGCIPDGDRIITIEDAAELRLQQEHVARLEARPPNIEGRGAVAIRDLVRNALRMRPDRIIIGEVRGGEALDMLQAMNTGHAGSMSTVHANSARDAISRLETMVLMAGMDLPVRAIRDQIVAALDLIVHQERQHDGSRKVTSITEVVGIEDGSIVLHDCLQAGEKPPVKPSKSRERRLEAGVAHDGHGVA